MPYCSVCSCRETVWLSSTGHWGLSLLPLRFERLVIRPYSCANSSCFGSHFNLNWPPKQLELANADFPMAPDTGPYAV